jgi:hypothetical protein
VGRAENDIAVAGTRASVLVSIDDEHASDLLEMAKRVSDVGMDVEDTMDLLGTLSGTIEPQKIEAIRAVEGVSDVELARSYQLPPPESPIQ